MARTTPEKVRSVIQVREDVDLSVHIATANALTNRVATKDTTSELTTDLLLAIETYLAAHFAALFDPQYRAKATGRASATFQGESGKRLDATDWGQQAIALDATGTLDKMNKGNRRAKIVWLGKGVQEQVDYWDRN